MVVVGVCLKHSGGLYWDIVDHWLTYADFCRDETTFTLRSVQFETYAVLFPSSVNFFEKGKTDRKLHLMFASFRQRVLSLSL